MADGGLGPDLVAGLTVGALSHFMGQMSDTSTGVQEMGERTIGRLRRASSTCYRKQGAKRATPKRLAALEQRAQRWRAEGWLRAKDAAALLGCNVSNLRRWANRNRIDRNLERGLYSRAQVEAEAERRGLS